jgi:ATP/ADP translocase
MKPINDDEMKNQEERAQLVHSDSSPTKDGKKNKTIKHFKFTPKMKSVLYMSLSMAVHFGGHEFARGPVGSLFTSKDTGFISSAALPLTVGFVSPFSAFVLWVYSKMLNAYGPRVALVRSTVYGSSFLLLVGLVLCYITTYYDLSEDNNYTRYMTKYLLFGAYVFQSANVQFLYTQHWSFLSSVLTPEEGKSWFAPIAGLGSITSTLAAHYVSAMVDAVGLTGLICVAAIIIGSSALFADQAYKVAADHGFEPKKKNKEAGDKHVSSDESIIETSKKLFKREPILGGLFYEVILSQCFSSLLNFHFIVKVKEVILDDKERAGWTGKQYAWINGVSGVMQFLLLPLVSKKMHERQLWLFMPCFMILLTSFQLYQSDSSLAVVGFTFVSLKTIEYSLRGQCNEIAFARLDYESRFLGKEMINLFANRLGKSAMALSMFLLTTIIEHKSEVDLNAFLVQASNAVAFLWLLATIHLTSFLPN